MQELIDRIRAEAEYVGDGIIKMDGFLNHQVDPALTYRMGEAFIARFRAAGVGGISKVVTAEVSGIPAALITALLLEAPLLYARKHQSSVMTDVYYMTRITSRTKHNDTNLMIAKKFLQAGDRVLVIDDFLATGATLSALCTLIGESGARLAGIGCVVEKPRERGRKKLEKFAVPVVTLAKVSWNEAELEVTP